MKELDILDRAGRKTKWLQAVGDATYGSVSIWNGDSEVTIKVTKEKE